MKLYKCKVRLHANPNDEVRKKDVTAAEIRILRKLHGEDAVIEIETTGSAERTEAEERDRLTMAYGEKAVVALFGAPVVKVEQEIADPHAEIEAKPELPVADGPRVSPEAIAAQQAEKPVNLFE